MIKVAAKESWREKAGIDGKQREYKGLRGRGREVSSIIKVAAKHDFRIPVTKKCQQGVTIYGIFKAF